MLKLLLKQVDSFDCKILTYWELAYWNKKLFLSIVL